MTDPASRPRLLLRRLHEVMAGPGTAQDRLDRVVRVIARNMVAEVCSVYLLRAGGILELFASEGLSREAVHHTRLRFDEGLVGLVAGRALPLSVQEASTHPRFSYRPETGEESYHSFLGVPIIRLNRVHGVLVVQNVLPRDYSAEEEEALQTVAMVLAELVASGELVALDEVGEALGDGNRPVTLEGQGLTEGIASGTAVMHEARVEVTRFVADDVEVEKSRIASAFDNMRTQIEGMITQPEIGTVGEHRDILETYKMFAYDRGWQQRILEAIEAGLTAEAAVERVQQQNRHRMSATPDPYLRERLSDLDDLGNRLQRILAGRRNGQAQGENSIIIARSMGPAELLDYDRDKIKGVVLEEGSPTSHVTILARAMGIPLVGRCRGATMRIAPGDPVIVDGDAARVLVRPGEEVAASCREAIDARAERRAQFVADRHLPATSRDGVHVKLFMNAGLLADMPQLETTGADGIGLFRTEFQFMVSATLPRLDTQVELYSRILETAGDKPVFFRTLDVGGDKAVPFLPREEEENPSMGWRAIRIALDRPVLLRYQMRALLKSAAGRRFGVMFPMVAEVAEYRAARAIVMKEVERARRLGLPVTDKLEIGVMLEVPALAWQLGSLLGAVDFVSIGTNDLLQFFFASDRSSPRLADRYDLLSPAVLNFIHMVVRSCDEAGVPVSVCGEMGGRPLEAMALIGLGVRRLSISPSAVGPVRRMIRSADIGRIGEHVAGLLGSAEHTLRSNFKEFACNNSIFF